MVGNASRVATAAEDVTQPRERTVKDCRGVAAEFNPNELKDCRGVETAEFSPNEPSGVGTPEDPTLKDCKGVEAAGFNPSGVCEFILKDCKGVETDAFSPNEPSGLSSPDELVLRDCRGVKPVELSLNESSGDDALKGCPLTLLEAFVLLKTEKGLNESAPMDLSV